MEKEHMTVGQFLKSYWKDCINNLKHPLNLLPTVLLAAIWIVLGWMAAKAKLALPLKVLSFLTFTEGGLFGGVLGAVGGIVGKVVVAAFVNAALLPLFHGKMPFSGVGNSFGQMAASMKLNSAGALRPLFYGLGVALLLYSFMNVTQSGQNAMVGIVAVVMLLQNIGNKGGFLWGFLFSMANSVTGGRVPDYVSVTRNLMGMTLGFTLAAGLSISGLHWCFWLAWPMLLLGFLLGLFMSKRAVGVALIVIATVLSTVDADALTRTRATKYGTLTYTIQNLEGKYKPGKSYVINATFVANDKVYGKQSSYMVVGAGAQELCRKSVIVQKNKRTSATASFIAPNDGSILRIWFGNTGHDVLELLSISPIEEDAIDPEVTEDSPPTSNEDANNDPDNESGDDGTDDGTDDINADEESSDEGFFSDLLDNDVIKAIQDFLANDPLGLNQQATPEEAVGIGSVAALLAALLGGAGAVGGGVGGALGGLGGLGGGAAGAAGGSVPPPIDGPSGPSSPYQSIEDKYVTRDPDGSITVKDPVTGEERLYLPDGQGGYDNPLGGGYRSEADMLEHLAFLERNSGTLSQDAATAAKNQAEQHAQWEAQNALDQARGYSDEMADYKQWKEEQEKQLEREIQKDHQILKLAMKYNVEATEEAVKKALKKDMIQAGVESAKQQAEAARNDMIVVGLESTKNVAATSLVLIPLALSGVGAVSATTMAKAKIVQSCYTMASSVTDKVGNAYVKGDNLAAAAVHGIAEGAVSVAQNYASNIGGKAAGLVPNAGKLIQTGSNLVTEAAVVIGGEGFKKGLDELADSGDLSKTLDATIDGMKKGAKDHLINKTVEFGIDKAKGLASSGKTSVESTRAQMDATGKTVASSKQAVTRANNQVTSAKGRVTAAQQNVTRSQQQVATAQGKVNTANEQLQTANRQVAAAQQKVSQAKTPAEMSKAQAELSTAQHGAAQAQQNVNRANSELQTAQRIDSATKRVAMHAENDLQKAQMGAQKAQSDLTKATAQHEQATRDAFAAEQQAQIDKLNDKTLAHATGNDIVGGGRAIEKHLENQDKIQQDNV